MSTPYVGQIQMFAFPFAPKGYALCQGQFMAISQNQTLFKILGTLYGGNGESTFGLPDMRGRLPLQTTKGFPQGVIGAGGAEIHILSLPELGQHNHPLMTDSTTVNGTVNAPAATEVLGIASGVQQPAGTFTVGIYGTAAPTVTLDANAIGPSGGGQPHANMMPYLTINYSIALGGLVPPHP